TEDSRGSTPDLYRPCALISEIDNHATPRLACENFGGQQWHVLEPRSRRHAVELSEIEICRQTSPSLFALLARGKDRVHASQRHVAQDEGHDGGGQVGTLREN